MRPSSIGYLNSTTPESEDRLLDMIEIILDQSTSAETQSGWAGIPARHEPVPLDDLVQFESGSNAYGIALGRNDEFILTASDDRDSATLKTPGDNLSSRLQRVLPSLAFYSPLSGSDLANVMERLLRCDVSTRLERPPSFPSTQLELSADEWMAQVRAWASSHPQRDFVVDDSRESMYGDRV